MIAAAVLINKTLTLLNLGSKTGRNVRVENNYIGDNGKETLRSLAAKRRDIEIKFTQSS